MSHVVSPARCKYRNLNRSTKFFLSPAEKKRRFGSGAHCPSIIQLEEPSKDPRRRQHQCSSITVGKESQKMESIYFILDIFFFYLEGMISNAMLYIRSLTIPGWTTQYSPSSSPSRLKRVDHELFECCSFFSLPSRRNIY